MHGSRIFWILGISAILTTLILSPSSWLFAEDSPNIQYEVLNPWGEADPKPLRGISPRLDDLSGKKIGLFANYKRAAVPIALSLKEQLESKYPDSKFNVYQSDQWNVIEIETENGEAFKKWVKGNDAVILMVGD
ncbi:MAG: hypothetical protein JW896_07065 [Deltaproteobacteria bacterium]|nr:hypothetical protein [Deltaproteobacteria bacterium]